MPKYITNVHLIEFYGHLLVDTRSIFSERDSGRADTKLVEQKIVSLDIIFIFSDY